MAETPRVDAYWRNKKDRSMNDAQRLASKMNWLRRMVMGALGNIRSANYQVSMHAHYHSETLTTERTDALLLISSKIQQALHLLDEAEKEIAEFHKLPKA